ncbi:MAG: response regulator [Clostridia bacterium]|nr:response regulator [Clostridia bacterium]
MNKLILFVDDEIRELESVKNLLAEKSYGVYIAKSSEEALNILSKTKVDLIISDIGMANIHEFIARIKKQYPKIFRVISSGQDNEGLALKAIQKNLAKLHVYKPWDGKAFIDIVNRIFEFKKTITSPELIRIINNFEVLPTLPSLYTDLCEAINNEEDIEKIAAMITKDQAVATKVLHVSNSAYYGMKTSSINQAIMNIGLNNIKDIVFATVIFNNNLYPSMMTHLNKLWEHAYTCNQLTLELYKKIFKEKVSLSSLSAGLLHDIGKLVLVNVFGYDYFDILVNHDCVEYEKDNLGITHQEIGGYLLDWWELPLPIVEVVLYHHDPLNDMIINKDLVAIVHLADYYSSQKVGIEPDNVLDEGVFEYLGVEKSIVEELIADYTAICFH